MTRAKRQPHMLQVRTMACYFALSLGDSDKAWPAAGMLFRCLHRMVIIAAVSWRTGHGPSRPLPGTDADGQWTSLCNGVLRHVRGAGANWPEGTIKNAGWITA